MAEREQRGSGRAQLHQTLSLNIGPPGATQRLSILWRTKGGCRIEYSIAGLLYLGEQKSTYPKEPLAVACSAQGTKVAISAL